MFKFFSDAFKEIGHVVWPTAKETRKYMNYTLIVIVLMTIFLSTAGYIFRTTLKTTKNVVNPGSVPTAEQIKAQNEAQQKAALQNLYNDFNVTASGANGEAVQMETSNTAENPGQTLNIQDIDTSNTEATILPSQLEETPTE